MKKIRFTNKANNETIECMAGTIGKHVNNVVNNITETNKAIRWCNSHVVGDSLDTPLYRIEIFGVEK